LEFKKKEMTLKKKVNKPENKDAIKHSATIHMAGNISLLERKTFNVLLAWAFNNLTKQETHEIPIRDLARYLRFNSNDHELLKNALHTLNTTSVQWNYLEKDKDAWESSTLLSGVRIINGVCIYGYSFVMRDRLSDPKMYAKLNLIQQSFFNRKHAHILWEIFKDYFDDKNGRGETPWIKIHKFKSLLGLRKDEYTQFKDLNKWVLKRAIKEINDISDLYVDLKDGIKKRKEGRKISALKFHIKKNPKNTITPKLLEEIAHRDQSKLPLEEIENQQLFNTLTTEFGISNNKAVEILKTKDEFYIDEVLNCVRQQIEAGNVKNTPAYTVKALEEDYRRQKSKDEIDKEQKQQRKKQAQEAKKIIENLKTEFDQQSKTQIEKFLNDLDESRKAQLVKDFEKDKIENSNNFIKRNYQKKGLESHGNQLLFRAYLAKRFLPEDVTNFEAFAKKQGHEVVQRENGEYELNIRKTVKL
jgi:plasmid replication initiation protein